MTIKTLSRTYHIIQFGLTLLKWVKYLLPFAIEIKMNVLYYTICIIRSYCWMNGFNFQIMLLLFIFNIFAEMCQSSMVIRVLDRNYINDLILYLCFQLLFSFGYISIVCCEIYSHLVNSCCSNIENFWRNVSNFKAIRVLNENQLRIFFQADPLSIVPISANIDATIDALVSYDFDATNTI